MIIPVTENKLIFQSVSSVSSRQMEHCPDTLDEVVEDDEDKSIHLKGIVVE